MMQMKKNILLPMKDGTRLALDLSGSRKRATSCTRGSSPGTTRSRRLSENILLLRLRTTEEDEQRSVLRSRQSRTSSTGFFP